ncbi:hypothetical protein TREES_T100002754 [Tupaia chinensis]|uniref:Uncharacterized protein n=1 Tax=Tupaia chinensis TaxID=246437 RepID=L9L2J9_TUPCH|nr:hypothetical protein TREES_T100002754 [Tupaia chinensis]
MFGSSRLVIAKRKSARVLARWRGAAHLPRGRAGSPACRRQAQLLSMAPSGGGSGGGRCEAVPNAIAHLTVDLPCTDRKPKNDKLQPHQNSSPDMVSLTLNQMPLIVLKA